MTSFVEFVLDVLIHGFEHIKNKLNNGNGKGNWDDSFRFMGDSFTAVISKNIEFAVLPPRTDSLASGSCSVS